MKFRNYKEHNEPFNYYTFDNFLCEKELESFRNIDLNKNASNLTGERTDNKNRYYVNEKNKNEHFVTERLIDFFTRKETINFFQEKHNLNLNHTYLRVELINDNEGSFLKPHKDIKEKLISLLVYINETDEDENIGTSLYDKNLEFVKTVPFKNNFGFYFLPGDDTWHGLEKIKVKKDRKMIMINYCTFKTDFKVQK